MVLSDMSTNLNSEKVEETAKDETAKDEKKKKRNLIQTKIVIRRLPSAMTEMEFLEIISPLPKHDYFRYVVGNRVLAPHNYCRAYLNFINVDDIIVFRDKYDGMEFEHRGTKNGHKLYCVIEYAPYQKVPKKDRKKEDTKVNTIEEDADYQKFLETLEAENDKEVLDVEKYLDELELRDKQNHNSAETPLTAFIKKRRDERKKIREERKRQDNDRRKKKDEERKKKREAEKKKKIESEQEKNKKRGSGTEIDGKKTLGETKKDLIELEKVKRDQEQQFKDSDKVKIYKKDLGSSKSPSKNQMLKDGIFSHLELEKNWTDEYGQSFPVLGSADQSIANKIASLLYSNQNLYSESKHESSRNIKDAKFKPSNEIHQKKWRDETSNDKSSDKGEGKYKPKLKPDSEVGSSSPRGRGRGYRPLSGNRAIRPQKYSEQRSRSARKSEGSK